MNNQDKVAVCSRSFSKNKMLRKILLEKYSKVKFNDNGLSLNGDSLIDFIKGYEKIIIGLEKITPLVLDASPNLKVVSKYGVGTDNLDLKAMKDCNVKLGWKGGVNKRSVSEMALCLMLMMIRRLNEAVYDVKAGNWDQVKGNLLSNKTIGILGFGNIGLDLYKLLSPFECNFLIYDELDIKNNASNLRQVSLDEVLMSSDIVSIHLPFNEHTENLIDINKLSLMKESSFMINLSRGGIVIEKDLKRVLENKTIAGAAMDVFKIEPPQDKHLISLENFVATPHMGGISQEGILDMGIAAIDGLDENDVPK